MQRRTLLALAAGGAVATTLPAFGRKIKPLRILILGGTRFIGLHMTALALERGHSVTFFNRGKTKADRFPQVERIKGDRNGEIDGLKDREWDVVIDNSGYVPRHVRLTAELLAPKVRQYVFTSSISGTRTSACRATKSRRWANSPTKPSRKSTAKPMAR
jgi:nucleoside-diphosphate-sugar epimerase